MIIDFAAIIPDYQDFMQFKEKVPGSK